MRRARWLALVLCLALLGWVGVALWQKFTRPVDPSDPGKEQTEPLGKVVDAKGPVASARVRIKGRKESVLTDAEGRFRSLNSSSPLTAWKEGYFIGGSAPDSLLSIFLTPLPTEDCERYEWVDPTPHPKGKHNCGNCHEEIYREWAGSGHARSATGKHFRNLYDGTDWHGKTGRGWSLLDQYGDGAGVCSACHAPTIRAEDPAYFDLRKVQGVAAQGVHCDLCHKIADSGGGKIGLTHGRFGLKLLRPEEGQLFFGPLDDVDRGEDAYSPLYRESRYCASCHEGTVFGVHVYSTYSEWLESPARTAGKECQTCHMKPTGKFTNIAPGKGGIERDPWTLGNHRFFDRSQAEMLRDCLQVAIDSSLAERGHQVKVEVVAHRVGHRVPTGFIDRHLLLVVEGLDSSGKPVTATEGPTLPSGAGKELTGQPGRLFAKLLKDLEGRSPAPFWKADPGFTDTRLLPHKPEETTFLFPAALDRVRVRLIYRRFWQEVAQTKSWPDDEIVVIDQTRSIRQSR